MRKFIIPIFIVALVASQAGCSHLQLRPTPVWPLAWNNWGDAVGSFNLPATPYWLPQVAATEDEEGIGSETLQSGMADSSTDTESQEMHYPAYNWEANIWRPSVGRWIRYYQGRGKEHLDRAEIRAAQYYFIMEREAEALGFSEAPLALAIAESGANPNAHSRAGAAGMWQFIRSTGKLYGLENDYWVDERMDLARSTHESMRHLRDLHDRFNSWELAYAAYNAGPRRVSRAIRFSGSHDFWTLRRRHFLPRETRNYVPKIVAIQYLLRERGWKNGPPERLRTLALQTVEVPPLTDLKRVAQLLHLNTAWIARNNPTFKIGTTPPDRRTTLVLPPNAADLLVTALDNGITTWLTEPRTWLLKQANSPFGIQKKYGIPARETAELNGVGLYHVFAAASKIRIPVASSVPEKAFLNRRERVVYRVRRGDTLSHIARRMRTTIWNLRRWNRLRNSRIYPGQRLVVYRPPSHASWLGNS